MIVACQVRVKDKNKRTAAYYQLMRLADTVQLIEDVVYCNYSGPDRKRAQRMVAVAHKFEPTDA